MISKEDYLFLKNHPAFRHFPIEHFDKIAAETIVRKVPKGQILFFDGERRNNLFLIYKGYVRIEQYDRTCSYTYIDYVKEHTLLPYGGMFNDECYHYSGVAITELVYFKIPVEIFEMYSKCTVDQLLFITNKLSSILRFHELRLRNANLLNAHDRIVQALGILWFNFCRIDSKLPFVISLTDLSKLASTSRETVGNVMKELVKDAIIEYNKKVITFKNKSYFESLLETETRG